MAYSHFQKSHERLHLSLKDELNNIKYNDNDTILKCQIPSKINGLLAL